MDPAKRMILKNLPPEVTKKEIADLIRKRSRSQPMHIDLGVNEDGTTRRYAHVSVEGLKGVIEAINGVPIRDHHVIAEQAKPHFSFKIVEANRKREREERDAEELRKQRAESFLAKCLAQDNITKDKPPRPFYHSKLKYSRIASEIAQKCRQEHENKNGPLQARSTAYPTERQQADAAAAASSTAAQNADATGAAQRSNSKWAGKGGNAAHRQKPKGEKKEVVPEPPKVVVPPPPTKEERKLSGLQAKLAALKEKLKAK